MKNAQVNSDFSKVLRIFGRKREEVICNCILKNFIICALHLRRSNQDGWDRRKVQHARVTIHLCNIVIEKPGGKEPLLGPGARGKDNIKMYLK